MLLLRLSVAAGFCALLAILASLQQAAVDPAVERARALAGERWYELSLGGEQFGYWVTRTEQDRSGRWVFFSEQVTIPMLVGTSMIVLGCLLAIGGSSAAEEHTETTSL